MHGISLPRLNRAGRSVSRTPADRAGRPGLNLPHNARRPTMAEPAMPGATPAQPCRKPRARPRARQA
ncbi:hypothetical protein ACGF7W_14255 [Streptomyces sp. NPDC048219]|uniref:hypothetical protein n=1 Tax=Streptomyces sp. NPDC048219 TaxID=3365517 RepID=UPI0037201E70